MADKLPWFPFHADDWLTHDKLRACSSAARGLWIDMLCLMHKNDRRGYLQLAGKLVSAEQLSRMTGRSTDETSHQLAELLNAGVASVSEHGIVFSRRMVADERKRQACSVAGKRGGGSPQLRAFKGTPKGSSKVGSKAHPKGASGSLSGSDSSSEDGGVGEGFDRFWSAYPRKVAKKDALKAWGKLSPDPPLLARILAALERFKRSPDWLKDRGQFIPYPASWLNAERWDDEVASPADTNGLGPVSAFARQQAGKGAP